MDIIEKSIRIQRKVEAKIRFFGKGSYGRILRMARKPTTKEYTKVVQITGAGILLIGLVGFFTYLIWNYGGTFFSTLLK